MALEGTGTVSDADPRAEDTGVTLLESDSALDYDLSHQVRLQIFDGIHYLAH